MPSAASTSRRFLTLLVAAGPALAGPGEAPHADTTKQIPKYCRLLNELPPDQRHAFIHVDQPDAIAQKPLDQWTDRDASQLKEALRLQQIDRQIPYNRKFDIENAFLDDHPDWKRERQAIKDLYYQTPRGQRAGPMKALHDHALKIHRQIGRDCEMQLG